MRTKDRKLQINDTLYIFRVPAETSLDPHDIIRAGRVMMIRVGIMPSVDVNGKALGSAARSWNPQKPIEVEPTNDIKWSLNIAVQRTKNLIEAEEKNPGTKLPRIAVVKHRGEKIQVCNDEPRYYFIPSKTFCHNCAEPIQGITKLEINSNGKVAREFPFEPTEPASMHTNGSKKWLHERCVAKSVIIDDPYNPEHETEEHKEKVDEWFDKVIESRTKPTTKEQVIEILKDGNIDSNFARGCAYIYLIMTN